MILALLLLVALAAVPAVVSGDPLDPTWDDSLPPDAPLARSTVIAVDVAPIAPAEPPAIDRAAPFRRRGPPSA